MLSVKVSVGLVEVLCDQLGVSVSVALGVLDGVNESEMDTVGVCDSLIDDEAVADNDGDPVGVAV